MSLFQKVIVKKYLKNLSSELVNENYKRYSEHFNELGMAKRIRVLKEEQYQEGFLRDLFVNCLGYTINPYENFNLTTEFKNKTDAEKADGAILKNGKPIAVIELKSTKTKDLKTIEKQAFNYKAHQSNCKYVITSNFEKIRLYINDATEFEEFNIFKLSENEFKFLYLCFSKKSIFKDTPAEMKEKSNQHEEQISKKLYNDYSVFRNSIFQNLTKNNPQFDKLLLFKKSQKLLDRFLFIFFAEDKGLIPPNIISKIIDDYSKLNDLDAYTPLYKIFTKYFNYINKGYAKLSIDAYNGGLFQFDEILDNVKIDDEILINDSLKLSNYDFDSEIDVNILGHIFEHSLTDIEKLNAEIRGENLDKKQTRRKKEGVFYTPNYITKYIVDNTVGTLCTEKKNELKLNNLEIDKTYFKKTKKSLSKKGEQLLDKLENYKEWLLSLKILDPACGSGAFLNQALNFLIDEHNFVIDLETDLRKGQLSLFDIDTAVLENNLYGVDINEESVEIAKLSLWLKTAKKGRKLTDLSKHIKCGNSLIDDPEIAGEKAFDWNKEFPKIMQNGGFDVIIGNPPYVVLSSFLNTEFEYLQNRFQTSFGRLNTFALFIEKTTELIKEKSKVGLIIPDSLCLIDYYSNLRKYLLDNYTINTLIDLGNGIFSDATVPALIIIFQGRKQQNSEIKICSSVSSFLIENFNKIKQDYYYETPKYSYNLHLDDIFLKLNQLVKDNKAFRLKQLIQIKIGVCTGNNKKFISNDAKFSNSKKVLKGKNISKYGLFWSNLFINYDRKQLLRARDEEIFLKREKLLMRQTSDKLILAYDSTQFYAIDSLFILYPKVDGLNLKYCLTLLNSKLLNRQYQKLNPEAKRVFAQVKIDYVNELPIIKIDLKYQQPFIEKANLMLSLNKQQQDLIHKFLHRLESNFEIENFSNKIKTFYNNDFKTLVSELKKKKIKLTLSQQDEWEEYFNNYKDEINELQKQINKTDKEIDQMVYGLYGLTKEEIEIVEGI